MSAIPTSKVNMSLDDIIKQSRKSGRGGRGRDRKNLGERRKFGERRKYTGRRDAIKTGNDTKEVESVERRTRLFVSNLQKEIVNSELRKIFSGVGNLKKCCIHWDDLGYSKGSADVEFENVDDAKKAIKDFNEAEIEGVAMKVEYAKSGGKPRERTNNRRPRTTRRNDEKRNSRRGGRQQQQGSALKLTRKLGGNKRIMKRGLNKRI